MDSSVDSLNVRGRPKERGPKGDQGPKDMSKGHSKNIGKNNEINF